VGVQRDHQHNDDRREDRRCTLRRPDRFVIEGEQPPVDTGDREREDDHPEPGDGHVGHVLKDEPEYPGHQRGNDPGDDAEVDPEDDLDG